MTRSDIVARVGGVGRDAIQSDLNRLENCADKNLLKFKGKHKALASCEEQFQAPGHAGGHPAGKQLLRKALGVLVDSKLNRSQQCPLAEDEWYPKAALGGVLPPG